MPQPSPRRAPTERQRVSYADAGTAERAAILALCAGEGVNRKCRVFLAVLYFTTSWSKLGDSVTLSRIAAVAQIKDDAKYRKTLGFLRELREEGRIELQRGRGAIYWVSLVDRPPALTPVPDEWSRSGTPGGPDLDHVPRSSSEKKFKEQDQRQTEARDASPPLFDPPAGPAKYGECRICAEVGPAESIVEGTCEGCRGRAPLVSAARVEELEEQADQERAEPPGSLRRLVAVIETVGVGDKYDLNEGSLNVLASICDEIERQHGPEFRAKAIEHVLQEVAEPREFWRGPTAYAVQILSQIERQGRIGRRRRRGRAA